MRKISPNMIKAQLEKILGSSEFMASKVLSRFLRYVVEQTLNGQSGGIKQYTVAVEALRYGADFDPQSNPNVRIHARKLRRALDRYYQGQGIEDPIRIDISKGSYVPSFLYNHTSSGAPVSSECPPLVSDHTPYRLLEPSIAVVMFENLTGKDENSFLAKGLTSEILVSLNRFSGLTVLGPLVQAEGKAIDFYQIYNEYKAMFVLQGRVRCQGSRIRITIDVTDASTGAHTWGRTFEFDLEKTSLFEIEDQVSSQVAGIIADGQGIVFRKIKTDTYQEHIRFSDMTHAILKYNHGWMTLAPQDWEQAIAALGNALKKHPDNALLTAMLANMYYADAAHDSQLIPDALSKAKKLINKAIDLDPNLQVAQYNLVPLNALLGRTEQCVAAAKKVVAMNPNHARILAGCAVAVTQAGAYDTGVDYIERAMKLNPHYPGWYHFVNYLVYYVNENYQEAWTEALRINIEGLLWHPLLRAAILGKLRRFKEAAVYIDELVQMKPEFPKRPKEYIKLLFVTDKHVEMIWDGLYKAGMRELQ